MTFSVYEITVPVMDQGLAVMDRYVDHAEKLEADRGMRSGEALGARLAPDMLTFGEQVGVGCNKVDAHMAKLLQRDPPVPHGPIAHYAGLRERIRETRAFLQRIQPADVATAQAHTYELTPPILRGWFGGDDYIRHLVIPDFFFHVTAAHCILRHLGAAIGKRDYLGNLSAQSGADYSR